jgi:4-alpha-glucanotransferase
MAFARASGILLHPTCFPSPYGIGDLGSAAYRFVDFLATAEQRLWQVLPLSPTGYGNSPYMSFSAIAGNPLLINPDILVEQQLLTADDVQSPPDFPTTWVDFARVIPYKMELLARAFQRFITQPTEAFHLFCTAEAAWLDDYALFMALQREQPEHIWTEWEPAIAHREPEALAAAIARLGPEIQFQQFLQFLFFQQWGSLKAYANERQIKIIGDIPIYVSHHSADVWAQQEAFALDPETGAVALMAGVPPDYFSETGQLWGNPVYNWDYLTRTEFAWWVNRFRFLHRHVDIIRIDHFRGFEAYWQIPAGETTAINGAWEKAPGQELFETLQQELGELPILAEDLGVVTPEMEALRDRFGFPGMRVLLFAFGGGSDNFHLPHHYPKNCVVYSGTHDNDTAVGWWQATRQYERDFFHRYVVGYSAGEPIHWAIVRIALASVADVAIIPLQDLLGLDNAARMNYPGTTASNWEWRYAHSDLLSTPLSDRLRELTRLYSRS